MVKRRILALVLALFLMLSLAPPASAAYVTLADDARFLGAMYDEIRTPSEGFAAFRSGKLWGFLSTADGAEVIPARYSGVGDFHSGYAPAADESGKWGYINRLGSFVGDRLWSCASNFSEGLAFVRDPESGLYGYISHALALVIGCKYLEACPFSSGRAAVRDADGWFFIDANGREITSARYLSVSSFAGSIAIVRTSDGCGAINHSGAPVVECAWLYANVGCGSATFTGADGCAYLLADGTLCKNTGFSDIRGFSESLAPVKVHDKWGCIDMNGSVVIPAIYDEIGAFSGGIARAVRAGVPGLLHRTEGFTPFDDALEVGDFDGVAAPVLCVDGWTIVREDGTPAATGLVSVVGGEGDRYVVKVYAGFRLVSISGKQLSYNAFPGASEWARRELRDAGALGLLDPIADLNNWSTDMTRARICALGLRFYELVGGGMPSVSGVSFSDTSDPAVLRASALGLVNGDGNGRFRPTDPLTREEAAVILSRLCALIGFTPAEVRSDLPSDMDTVSDWAADAVTRLYRAGVFKGDDTGAFRPGGRISTEQSAVTLYRLLYTPGELN